MQLTESWLLGLDRVVATATSALGTAAIERARVFIREGWAAQALALGWTEDELMGVCEGGVPDRPYVIGVAYRPGTIRALTSDGFTLVMPDGAVQHERLGAWLPARVTLPWSGAGNGGHLDG